MPNQRARQLMIENFQDSLRLVRHLMGFGVEKFAEAIGVTRQTINNLETKKSKMSPTQYIAIAALTDNYFAQNDERFSALRAILDSDGKNYGAEYETAFRDDSLLKRWFEDFIDYGEEDFEEESCDPGELWDLPQEYKIFLDAEIFTREDAANFVKDLTEALRDAVEKAVVPLRSIEKLQAEKSDTEFRQAMTFIKQMRENNVLQVHGEDTDPNFHDTVLAVFERFRNKYELCLITPNVELARDVLQLNDSAAEDDFEIAAGFVEEGAFKFYTEEILAANNPDKSEENLQENNFIDWTEL